MPTSVGPDGIDVSGLGWSSQSTQFNSRSNLESSAGPTSTASTPVFVSGTAQQLSTSFDTMLYVDCTTSASLAIAIGPTSATANTILATETAPIGQLISVLVPAGWWVKLTGTMADLTLTAVTTKL